MSIFMILSAPATSLGLFSLFLKMFHNSPTFGLIAIAFCMCIHILHRNVKLQICQKKVNKGYQIWLEVEVDFPGTVFWISGNISLKLTSRIRSPAWLTTTSKSPALLIREWRPNWYCPFFHIYCAKWLILYQNPFYFIY